jgi:hypothetical protein
MRFGLAPGPKVLLPRRGISYLTSIVFFGSPVLLCSGMDYFRVGLTPFSRQALYTIPIIAGQQ